MNPSVTKFGLVLLLALLSLAISASQDKNGADPPGEGSAGTRSISSGPFLLSVLVFNHAEVAPADLEETQQSAAAIFRLARIDVEWRSFSPSIGVPPVRDQAALSLNLILPGKNAHPWMKRTLGLPKTALGFALTQPQGAAHGNTAYVFVDLVEELVHGEKPARLGVVLGNVVAHELGHLLLGQGHAPCGLMSAEIGKLALRLAGANKLHFTRAETRKLRDAMVERTSRR